MERKPNDHQNFARIQLAIEYLAENRLKHPDLAEVSRVVGLSEFHFQRIFKQWAGVSPKNLLQFLTLEMAKQKLSESRDILSTTFEVGLSGPGRLHDLFVKMEAMTPGEYKQQGEGLSIEYGFAETPFGEALFGATKRGICHLHFVTESKKQALRDLEARWPRCRLVEKANLAKELSQKVFRSNGSARVFAFGSPFQIKVWEALLRIPEGCVVSYQDVAKLIGQPNAIRAVGTAIARNEIGYLIPCHRVIRANGVIGEYRWGPAKKTAMLCRETIRGSNR